MDKKLIKVTEKNITIIFKEIENIQKRSKVRTITIDQLKESIKKIEHLQDILKFQGNLPKKDHNFTCMVNPNYIQKMPKAYKYEALATVLRFEVINGVLFFKEAERYDTTTKSYVHLKLIKQEMYNSYDIYKELLENILAKELKF